MHRLHGRKRSLTDKEEKRIKVLRTTTNLTVQELSKRFNVSRGTIERVLRIRKDRAKEKELGRVLEA